MDSFRCSGGDQNEMDACAQVMALIGAGKPEEALKRANAALSLPRIPAALMMMRAYLLAHLGNPEEALASIDAVLGKDSRLRPFLSLASYYATYMRKADLLMRWKRYEEAVQTYGEALALDNRDPMLHSSMGQALAYLKRYSEALTAFDRALEHASEEKDATIPFAYHQMNKANALSSLCRYEEAVPLYRKARSCGHLGSPLQKALDYNLACTLALLGCYSEAYAICQQIIDRDATFKLAYLAQAEVCMLLDQLKEAEAIYARLTLVVPQAELAAFRSAHQSVLPYRVYIPAIFEGKR